MWILAAVVALVLLGLGYVLLGGLCMYGCNWDLRRISNLRQIQEDLSVYFNKCGVYPGGAPKPGSDPKCLGIAKPAGLGEPLINIPNIPKDPVTGTDYAYCYAPKGASYVLQAKLEDIPNSALTDSLAALPAGCTNTEGTVTCDKSKGEYCVSP